MVKHVFAVIKHIQLNGCQFLLLNNFFLSVVTKLDFSRKKHLAKKLYVSGNPTNPIITCNPRKFNQNY